MPTLNVHLAGTLADAAFSADILARSLTGQARGQRTQFGASTPVPAADAAGRVQARSPLRQRWIRGDQKGRPPASLSWIEKRNAAGVGVLRDRLQIGVDIRQVLVGQNLLAERRHLTAGRPHVVG